jgi:hypothetical protein
MAQQQFEYISLDGVIIPDTEDTRNIVVNEFKSVFGQDIDTSSQTPQGVLINLFVLERNAVLRNNADLANQINPNQAGGTYLDAIAALTGLSRSQGTPSFALCRVAGVPGTVIPAGSVASTQSNGLGDRFVSISDVTLNASGIADVEFQCTVNGPISAPANTIIYVDAGVLGWETVTNQSRAILGTLEQSDQAFRVLRRNTLALQARTVSESTISAVANINGVKGRPKYLENITSSIQVIEDVTMKPHSIFVCVDGGLDEDIANEILATRSCGCGFNGTTTIPITDPFSGQIIPVQFQRPDIILILVRVTISQSSLPDAVAATKDAILKYANGELPSSDGLIVSQNVSCPELSKAIGILYPDIFIDLMEISYSLPLSYVSTELNIKSFEKAVILSSAIEVIEL